MAKRALGYLLGKPIDGYVYLIHAKTGHYKIGRSYDPVDRIKAFKTEMPLEIDLLHVIPADDVKTAEKELHLLFANSRHKGEWFSLTDAEIQDIYKLAAYINGQWQEYTPVNLSDIKQRRQLLEAEKLVKAKMPATQTTTPTNQSKMPVTQPNYKLPTEYASRSFESLSDELANRMKGLTKNSR